MICTKTHSRAANSDCLSDIDFLSHTPLSYHTYITYGPNELHVADARVAYTVLTLRETVDRSLHVHVDVQLDTCTTATVHVPGTCTHVHVGALHVHVHTCVHVHACASDVRVVLVVLMLP